MQTFDNNKGFMRGPDGPAHSHSQGVRYCCFVQCFGVDAKGTPLVMRRRGMSVNYSNIPGALIFEC